MAICKVKAGEYHFAVRGVHTLTEGRHTFASEGTTFPVVFCVFEDNVIEVDIDFGGIVPEQDVRIRGNGTQLDNALTFISNNKPSIGFSVSEERV